ncbi:uncharacterized protein Dwil_GK12812 [Drosophila willistoni]|uniref:CLIP domain-containing serine protease n=1 Tax=Drosophila willistoni TaxID=7260 RepID=B4NJU5_DROWI|nr:serine protease easter [Drosophila willistoni]EDW85057.1 uncharacterized protein Dwil_GK12812 [Drosophila willistoni]
MGIKLFIVAVVFCSLALSAAGQRTRTPDCLAKLPDGRVGGHCIPVRQCDFFMKILEAGNVSDSDRILLRENQCDILNQDIQACCPSTVGLGALNHPLLPRDCGRVKWQRNNQTETTIREYPWLALIEFTKQNNEKIHACGGVLISQRYLLTAAHCIHSSNWTLSGVRVGEWDTSTNPDCQVSSDRSMQVDCAPTYQDIAVEEVIVHPLYQKNSFNQTNDIALIRLGALAQLNDFVQPICLPNKQLRADELEGLVTEVGGWQAKTSTRMRKSQVIITSLRDCQEKYSVYHLNIQPSQLCGKANANECHGNSGGPLMLYKNDAYLLGGLLSFGPVPCPSAGWPDVFTRVASYIEWIHSKLRA